MGAPKKRKPLSEKQRESDEKLREELRNFDLKKFDKALDKAIAPKKEAANQKWLRLFEQISPIYKWTPR